MSVGLAAFWPKSGGCLLASLLVVALAGCPAPPAPAPPAPPPVDLALVGGRVFTGERVIEQGFVLVRGGMVVAVGEGAAPADARARIDATGKTVLPGLIDAHAHNAGDTLTDAVMFGVTTVIDMAAPVGWARARKAEQAAGPITARADLITAMTPVTVAGGHGTEYGVPFPTLDDASEAAAFVAARLAEGSDFIKIVYDHGHGTLPTLSEEALAGVVAATRAHRALAVAHVGTLEEAATAVRAGVHGLAHVHTDRAGDTAFARAVAEAGVFVVPTLTVYQPSFGLRGGATLLDEPALAALLTPARARRLAARLSKRPAPGPYRDRLEAAVRLLHEAGVVLLAGSDAANLGTTHGLSLHHELELLTQCGLTPVEALVAATRAPAQAFGLTDRGVLAPGRVADVLVVDGDPTRDVRATRAIHTVLRNGAAVDRAGYLGHVADARRAWEASRPPALLLGGFEGDAPYRPMGLGWQASTDRPSGGRSTAEIALVDGGAERSRRALRVRGELVDVDGVAAWAGVILFPGAEPFAPVDLSRYTELHFAARGPGGRFRLMVFTAARGYRPQIFPFEATPSWERHRYSFEELATDGADITAILFSADMPAGGFELYLDAVTLR